MQADADEYDFTSDDSNSDIDDDAVFSSTDDEFEDE